MHAGEQAIAPGRTTPHGDIVHEDRTLAADVGRFSDHQTAVVDTGLHPADVVAHDEEDVRFLRATASGFLGSRTHSSRTPLTFGLCVSAACCRSDPTSAGGKASGQYRSDGSRSVSHLRAIEDSFDQGFLKTPSMVCNSAAESRGQTHNDFLEMRRIMLARPGFFFITVITGGARTLRR